MPRNLVAERRDAESHRVSQVISRAEELSKELTVTVGELVDILREYQRNAEATDARR